MAKEKSTTDDSIQEQDVTSAFKRLSQELEQIKAALKQATHERDEYRKLYELVFLDLERTRSHIFGHKSERVASGQLPLLVPAYAQTEALLEKGDDNDDAPVPNRHGNAKGKSKNKTKKKPTGRRPLPEHLPVERIVLPPPPPVAETPSLYKKIGEDVSETLERRPASMVRVQIVRPKFAKIGDPYAGVIAAELPAKPIEKGLAGPGLLAQIVTNKHCDQLPLYRQEKMFEREGLTINRSTMCGWIEKVNALVRPVFEAMYKESLKAHCIATDATGVLVQSLNECRRGHFWVMIADRDHILFFYSRRHNSAFVKEILGSYKGTITADAHKVFDFLFNEEDEDSDRIESGCMSHCRRYFIKALSTAPERSATAIEKIRKLFMIEREIAGKSPDFRKRIRQEKSKGILEQFFAWCKEQQPLVLDDTPIQKAIGYALNQQKALSRFLEDGQLEIHNNFSELQLRHLVIGRKNWLFLGSEDGAQWNCTFTSLIASCRLHGIEPWAYLRDLFVLIADWPRSRVLELSPKYWKQTLQDPETQRRLKADIFRQISAN